MILYFFLILQLIGPYRIVPRHVLLAIKNDNELDELLKGVIIPDGGVIPHINPVLLPKNTKHRNSNPKHQENGESQEH